MIGFILGWLIAGFASRFLVSIYKETFYKGYITKHKDLVYGSLWGGFGVMYLAFFFLREFYRGTRSGKVREWLEKEL